MAHSSRRDDTRTLKIWEKLIIVVGDDEQAGYYEGRVEDFINGGIVVNNPIFLSGSSMIRQDLPVTVQICRDDAIYQFASRIHSYSRNNGRRLVLAPPQSLRRIQRRQFVRIEMSSPVAYTVVPDAVDWSDWENSLTWTESHLVDISAGGAQIRTTGDVAEDNLVLLNVDFFAEEELPSPIIGRCCRAFASSNDHFAGLQFLIVDRPSESMKHIDISRWPAALKRFSRRQQDKLSNYLFRKQVEFRQKGIL